MHEPTASAGSPLRRWIAAEWLVVALALLLATLWTGWTTAVWFRYHPQLPWRDLFLVLGQVLELQGENATFRLWIEPHYGTHRIAIPRLLMLLDTRYLAGQNHSFYALGWVSLIAITVLYTRLASGCFRDLRTLIFVASLALIWLFSPSHLWNLVNPINISWHLSFAGVLLAFFLLLQKPGAAGVLRWGLAYLLCAASAFCTFAGVIAWLMLPVIAMLYQRRALLPALVLSVTSAGLYSAGMSSDAVLASQWDIGTPAVIEQIRGAAEAALAANTPLHIAEKTLRFLTWPYSAESPLAAKVLGLGSIAVLALYAVSTARAALRRHEKPSAWISFCLIVAGLCLGVAVATQLGRVLVHPNHIHGPSYERYQTVVVMYWLSLSGLLLAHKPRSGARAAAIGLALVALALVQQAPAGSYLREEIQSAESAARLFNRGRLAQSRGLSPTPGNRFTPEFVYSFDAYYVKNQLAYRAPAAPVAGLDQLAACARGAVRLSRGPVQGFPEFPRETAPRTATAEFGVPRGWAIRAVLLYQGEQLVGRLSPVHQGEYRPHTLLSAHNTRWQGLVLPAARGEFSVLLETATGIEAWCRYSPGAPG